MSTDTKIEWTRPPGFRGATWNPTRGCRKLSAGCKHCYAETFAERWRGIPGHAYDQGFDPRTVPDALDLPLRKTTPTCWFVDSMSDLFLEDFTDEYIAAVFGVMAAAPRHRFLVLTKRAERMRRWFEWIAPYESCDSDGPAPQGYALDRASLALARGSKRPLPRTPAFDMDDDWMPPVWPLPNVWLGVSVEDQATADERIPHLLATPAAVRFVSYEPALGPVDFGKGLRHGAGCPDCFAGRTSLDWLIVGGESGPGARPFDVAWARSAVEQCRAAGVACFYKQGGSSHRCEHSAKGGCLDCAPEDLRVREFPNAT